jgi:carbon-monoxide dehydrogenase large subunit
VSILGNRVLRKEDPKLLTSGGEYVDDVRLAGALHATYVRSTMAHGRITTIDAGEAAAAPGVVAVVTGDEVAEALGAFPHDMDALNQDMRRPWLATDTVRYVGEAVAVVVSETRATGEDAAELVLVDYEPLPVVVDAEEALADGAVLLHEAAGTNVAFHIHKGRRSADFDGCDVVVRQRIRNQRVAPCPLEMRAAAARWEDDGRLTHWASTQGPHSVRDALARVYGIEPEQVRVITPDVGGGFGAKGSSYPEELLLAWLARRVGAPVRWAETRSESMVNLGHGRGQVQDVEIGGTRDGRILAYRMRVVQDAGAYPRMGAVLPFMTRMMLTGCYDIPSAEFTADAVVTNTTPTVAYRGAGRPEAAAAVERAVDLFAAEVGMDPAEVRRVNLVAPDRFPFTAPMGTTYDSGDYAAALSAVLAAGDYDGLRAEQAQRRAAGSRLALGVGLSTYVEITGGGPSQEYAAIDVRPDGSVLARTGTSPHGQGHVTAWAMLIRDRTGIPLDRIDVVHGDTDVVPQGGVTGGSRSLQVGGVAMHEAAGSLVDEARRRAAELLEAAVEDVVLDVERGAFHVAGTPAVARSWAEVASAPTGDGDGDGSGPLAVEHVFRSQGATFPSGAHLAVVEVDLDTGHVRLVRFVAADDAGRILNPLLAAGQVHGGLAQGIAQALLEEMVYDADGNPLTSTLADYAFVSACELPSFERLVVETPTPLNELGAKGIGESGTIGATPAVQNAVVDALAHLGVSHVDIPCTPERVWRAIAAAGYEGGGEGGP